jgi:hypothetical protein
MTDTSADERRPINTADMVSAVEAHPKQPAAGAETEVGIQAREADAKVTTRGGPQEEDETPAPLMAKGEATGFRDRWQDVQVDFVDDPRVAVERADALVAELMQQLAREFTRERDALEKQWSGGGQASTEDLRLALQRYRSFFSRLLSV